MTVPMLMPNAACRRDQHGASTPARAPAPSCRPAPPSTESIVNAYEHLQAGLADVVIAGGTEAAIHPLPIAAFASMQALSRRNDDPATASRPYDVDRDGFVMGEGAGAIVLETEEHALARGARIYAELAGGGVTSDAYHITAPDPEGSAAARAMLMALEQAGATPDDVTHINAHATSTPVGDIAEYKALLARVRRPPARDPGVGDQGGHRPPARRHRRAGGDLHDPGPPRPHRAADDQPDRAGPGDPAATSSRRRATLGDGPAVRDQQLVRLRRPQRRRRVPQRLSPALRTSRMRIAIVSDYFNDFVGGAQTSMHEQFLALTAAGHHVVMVSAGRGRRGGRVRRREDGLELRPRSPCRAYNCRSFPTMSTRRPRSGIFPRTGHRRRARADRVRPRPRRRNVAERLGLRSCTPCTPFTGRARAAGTPPLPRSSGSCLARVIRWSIPRMSLSRRPVDNLLRNLTLEWPCAPTLWSPPRNTRRRTSPPPA